MSRKSWQLSGLGVVACLLLIYFLVPSDRSDLPDIEPSSSFSAPALPDFTVYQQVPDKKEAFFTYVFQFVQEENRRIAVLRAQLVALSTRANDLSENELRWLQSLAEYYRVNIDPKQLGPAFAQLLTKVDQVPASLALAQSANESAWGTSRFALKGNNLFGQWCFSKGCGIVPGARESGANHEVAKFSSPKQSVEAYIKNLNSNQAYRELRTMRAQLRKKQQPLSGHALAGGLSKYSERGDAYIEELRAMMRINKLTQYDAAKKLEG